jgi:hypothetical protein
MYNTFEPDPLYDLVAPTRLEKLGVQCGRCGQKISHGRFFGYRCPEQECPVYHKFGVKPLTPESETFNVPIQYIQEFIAGDPSRLQQPLDDAIARARTNAFDEGVIKSIIIKIVPEGATNPGESSSFTWSQEISREYLYPPGDSARLQVQITNPMTDMGRSATNNFTVTSVIMQITPT